jgi:hypothetical protein
MVLFAGTAFAQSPDPAVVQPRAGSPALVSTEAAFRLVLRQPHAPEVTAPPAVLEDDTGQTFPLQVAVQGPWQDGIWCTARMIDPLPQGAYTLVVGASGQEARYPAAVWVRPNPEAYYVVAHVRGDSADAGASALQEAFDSGASFAVMTGPLTPRGTPEELAALYARIIEAPLPVIVAGAAQDNKLGHFRDYFSTAPWGFRYGDDGFIVTPTTDRPASRVASPQDGSRYDGLIAYWRNALIGARWVVAVIPEYRTGKWLRLDQTLLTDDPVAAVITGPVLDAGPAVRPSPWGDTLIVHAPDQAQGKVRIVDVTAQGPRPRALAGDRPKEDAPTTE